MYIYRSSTDSPKLHDDNTWSDFIVTLPAPLYLDREDNWEIGLCDLTTETSDRVSVSKTKKLNFFCNIIESSYMKDGLYPVLKSAQFRKVKNDTAFFSSVYYTRLSQDRIDSVRIY